MAEKEYITIYECCAKTGLPYSRIATFLLKGKIPNVRKIVRHGKKQRIAYVGIPLEWAERVIEERTQFLSITKAAKFLGLSRQAMYNAVNTGHFKTARLGHNGVLIIAKEEIVQEKEKRDNAL